jgi:NCS1 family nucleobase:cation symporter-1
MAIALPITVTISAMIGVFVTTATTNMSVNGGVPQWNPLVLLIALQKETYVNHPFVLRSEAGLIFRKDAY